MIGTTVWLFDKNIRVYRDGQVGPVFREHFRPYQIVGETRDFWLLGNKYQIVKKTGMLKCPNRNGSWYALSPRVFWSELEIAETSWVNDNRHRIARDVENCDSSGTLRAIDALLQKEPA